MFKRNDWFIGLGLVAALVVIFVLSFTLAPAPADGEEAFGGTDAAVTAILEEDNGVEPWFNPIFEPGSGEIESGLFAVQAALGAGILGFALGQLRGRAAMKRELASLE
ncbi:MAG: energy-coupling factor ABC transporter substrate-binding protein [Tessaracoccus sp.]|uniref:energy-coupling factor ABC transporter substrate-binding protein n=1 Tax=Tessaracoccus sp. TaxID=1971211 RepID=UPI001EC4183E|nr:energy-coupling factor ABC transporter substrate-binding protein [Tessaracoccus sp.]MBK7820651.1 energy-coupling factor ABC transporter substrate-binding protein [Tessaracoccus sp.]